MKKQMKPINRKVTIFSTHCPQCNMLEIALKSKGIPFSVVFGEEEIIKRGFSSAPVLEVDGNAMNYRDAIRWVNAQEAGEWNAR